ncbi:MAG TPA: hypothetical protein VH475_13020 [Tepidisphaeraceae bacterium]|jgi:hypothetical protein
MTPTVRTPEHEERIVAKLARGWSIHAACKVAKISRQTYYTWRTEDEDFAALCDDAIEMGTDYLEDVATRQATDGNTSLMVLLLKARRPEKYRERLQTEHVGDLDHPLTVILKRVNQAEPSPDGDA